MKKVLLSVAIFTFIIIFGCKDTGVGFIPTNNNIYPAKLNTEWEYNSVMITEYYDSAGNIYNRDTMYFGNTIVRVIKINDTLKQFSNLIKFESYDLSTPENKSYHWYLNSDTGFVTIAYSNPGSSQTVYPKIKEKRYLTFEEFKSLINSPEQNFFSTPFKISTDSVLYYEIPRKVLAYPLAVNKRWVELILPWYRERYVDRIVNINFNGLPIDCYEVKIDWPSYNNIEFNDFVSTNYGLVKREILSDSIMFTSETSPDSGSFGKVSSFSNLVRIDK